MTEAEGGRQPNAAASPGSATTGKRDAGLGIGAITIDGELAVFSLVPVYNVAERAEC